MITEKQLFEASQKRKAVKNLIDKIKEGKPTNITYECLRIALKTDGLTTNEKELRSLLQVIIHERT